MRSRFPGYYRPSAEEFEDLWQDALVVLDTNVLLTLYRLSEPTRDKLLEILKRLEEQLFVPHQVAFEFQENRLNVIADQEAIYEQLIEELRKFPETMAKKVRRHPRLDRNELRRRLDEALQPIRDFVEEVKEDHPDPLTDGDSLGADVVRDALDPLLADCVGEPRDIEQLRELGTQRYERRQPPGWADRAKPEPDCYGDLAIWLDVIKRARETGKAVIMVSEERKEDWWWTRNGKLLGPRPELVQEMQEEAGQTFYLYNLERFMAEGTRVLGLEFGDDERDDLARAQDAETSPPWTTVLSPQNVDWLTSAALGSGAIPLFESSSLPNLFEAWAERYRWQSSAQVQGRSVLLTVVWPGRSELMELVCRVTGPGGGVAETNVLGAGSSAACVYPGDFLGESEVGEGDYQYTWIRTGLLPGSPGAVLNPEVASGGFRIESARQD